MIAGTILLRAPSAQAQLIDTYLDRSLQGTGVTPGVTVASRSRPEYTEVPVRLGSFLVQPELDQSFGYDDNVTGSSRAQGSTVSETTASLGAISNWSRDSLGAFTTVDTLQYPEQPRQSFTNWSASLAGRKDIGRDALYASYTHLNLDQTSRTLDAPQLDHPVAVRVDDLRAVYETQFSRLLLRPSLDVTDDSYDNGIVGGLPYLQNFRDRIVISPSLEAHYEMAPLRNLVLVVRDSQASYRNRPAGTPTRNFNDASLLGGIDYDTGGLVQLRLLAGYERRDFTSGSFPTIAAPVVEASAVYTPTGLTTLTATASRYIEDAAADLTVGYTETALAVQIDHEYLHNVVLKARAAYLQDDYAQGQSSQSLYTGSFGATWLLSRSLRLAFTYTISDRQSGTSSQFGGLGGSAGTFAVGQAFGSSYVENQVLLQLRVGL
ncbi:MAG: outer membrane beta-barrel protein [Janthinobacterium lividum]